MGKIAKKANLKMWRAACVLALLLLAGVVAYADAGGVPHKAGEVVVAGAPSELPAGYEVVKYLEHANLTVVKAARGGEGAAAASLRARGKRAGVNLIALATADTFTPDDMLYPLQWHFEKVQAPEAWYLEDGNGVIVAVLDTGLVPGGDDGLGCSYIGYNTLAPKQPPFDGSGHGTHVAGTIAQSTNNGRGIAGLAFGACVLPVKVLNDAGSGTFADIAEGIHYAVDFGAKVINMSLSTNARLGIMSDPILDPALAYARQNGVTVVASSGNDGNRKNVGYPAYSRDTISVGATDFFDSVTRYSNKGKGLDLVAPGGDLGKDQNFDGYGDGVLQETYMEGRWGLYFFQGTSMAAPHVSAAAAILIANEVATTPDEVRSALLNSAKDIEDPGFDKASGHGLLQVYSALIADDGDSGDGGDPPLTGDTDSDGDGWFVEDGDCDDSDAHIYPGHNDTRGRWGRDGVDNDCNGTPDA